MLEIVEEKHNLVVIMWSPTLESINQLIIPNEETPKKEGKEHLHSVYHKFPGTLLGFLLTPAPPTWYQKIPN